MPIEKRRWRDFDPELKKQLEDFVLITGPTDTGMHRTLSIISGFSENDASAFVVSRPHLIMRLYMILPQLAEQGAMQPNIDAYRGILAAIPKPIKDGCILNIDIRKLGDGIKVEVMHIPYEKTRAEVIAEFFEEV